MEQLQVIHEQVVLGKNFKVYGTKEEPLFLASDVAEWIEYSVKNTYRLLNGVDEDEKAMKSIHTIGGTQEAWFLTEHGLYEVLMQSRKPIAKQFKKQVKNILKEIRLNGGYIATNEEDTEELILARALLVAQKAIDRKNKQLEEANKVIEEQAPKVEKYEQYLDTDGTLSVENILSILREQGYGCIYTRSAHMLNSFLKEKGVQYKRPYASYLTITKTYAFLQEEGYAVLREVIVNPYKTVKQLRWTPKGVDFIAEMLVASGEVKIA